MGLVEHAEREMRKAGLYDKDADYGGMIPEGVMKMVKIHAEEGHSGGSHWLTMSIFDRVINFKTLTPITSDPEDWIDQSVASGEPFWQNRRDPSYFSKDGGKTWWCLDGEPPEETTDPKEPGSYWAQPPDGPVRVVSIDKASFSDDRFMMNPGTDRDIDLPVEGWRFFGPLKEHQFEEPEEEVEDANNPTGP